MIDIIAILFNNLSNRVSLIILLAFVLSQVGMFQKLVSKKEIDKKETIILIMIFASIGIIGTYTGVKVNNALVNARVIGVFVGGLLGGPVVGIFSGVLAGAHRYIIDINGFSALACAISTTLEGVLAGYLKKYFDKSDQKVLFSFVWGVIAEIMQMIIILIVAKPYKEAVELVKLIGIPMIIANGLGIAAFIFIVERFLEEVEKEAAYQAQSALKIANKTLKYFRKGYNKEIAEKVANIIKSELDIDAVALTDTEKILAHVGVSDDHHLYGVKLQTQITKDVIEKGNYIVSNNKEEINCSNKNCKLRSAVIVPLYEKDKVIGTLKLYKTKEKAITDVEREIAVGLARIFSTQIELSKLDMQEELLTKAELKMLQAQINPHFLFNAINTISSLIRVNPDKARELLIHLGNYFRNNLNSKFTDISIQEEINNIDSYMQIEKARFEDKLEVIYDIEENLECFLPALIIQPLAENAVKHGILNKIEGGKVVISARRVDEKLVKIVIEDNGVGMDSEKLENLLSHKCDSDCVGVNIVNDRLINKYGQEYSLKIYSKLNEGTKVIVNIPS